MNATYEDYKALIEKVMNSNFSPYIGSEMRELDDIAAKIDEIEAAHPEYEEALCEGI